MSTTTADPHTRLSGAQWRQRRAAHQAAVDDLIGTYLRQRRSGATHPVIDFLFTYYSSRPSHVTRWHPGHGVVLDDAAEYRELRGYRVRDDGGVEVSDGHLRHRATALGATVGLLRATAERTPRLGCFGLHEWAMVYRAPETRHSVPLRLGAAGTDAVVDSMPVRCTHFDAFRFFTPQARPLNEKQLDRDERVADEQPGCLHATMDLYRACFTLSPLIDSDLTFACFALALRARELDMRASPYDLSNFGYVPVPIETPAGRAQYVREQTTIADNGAVLRAAVADRCDILLSRLHELR